MLEIRPALFDATLDIFSGAGVDAACSLWRWGFSTAGVILAHDIWS
jgi:hypothetical protein